MEGRVGGLRLRRDGKEEEQREQGVDLVAGVERKGVRAGDGR
ncbi:MAG: hypothetical protein VX815_07205 [Gemmatimonadota bacterium]|nr:hypothetical protein [Gemmatimonadota bacterium]